MSEERRGGSGPPDDDGSAADRARPDAPSPDDVPRTEAAHGEAETRLAGAGDSAAPAAGRGADAADLPRMIGPYVVVGKLGEGGMGIVYEAEQQQPRRRVAVKVVRGGQFVDEERVRMFRREIDTLARLKHPNIGAIYESGRTDDGQHYFAMELVRGPTLSEFLDARPREYSARELRHRLGLFRMIADAVHHAHQRGVIHRDLKPSNIIVIEPGEAEASRDSATASLRGPQVKILDFGLARITDSDVAAATMATEIGVIKGTLPYMSPEQARGNSAEIDVRSDVYALGVILFEMIAGDRPYDTARASIVEAVRIICEEPPRPLTRTWSGTRRPDEDLRTIVGKALEKEADRRYASAAALSDDVSRYLLSQPILARPPSLAYQLRTFARRNKVFVGGVAATTLALVAGLVLSTSLYVRAEREAERARVEAAESEQVAAFLSDMLAGVGPQVAQGRDTTIVREILDQTAERIGDELGDQPEVEAAILSIIGSTYTELGEFETGQEHLRRALELYREARDEEHGDVARALNDLGLSLQLGGDEPGAVPLLTESVEIARRAHGDVHVDTALYATNLANLLVELERFDEAEPLLREALATRRAIHEGDHDETATSLNSLGNLLHHKGEYEEAETLYREALAMHRATLGERHPFVAIDIQNLAYLMKNKGDLAASEAMFGEALELCREIYGENHPQTAQVMSSMSTVLQFKGDFDGAETMLREALGIQRLAFGEENASVARTLDSLGLLLSARGDERGALQPMLEALAIRREVFGERSLAVASSLGNLGAQYRQLGDYDEAGSLIRQAIAIESELAGPRHPNVLRKNLLLARLLRSQDDLEGAEKLYRETLEARIEVIGASHHEVGTTRSDLGLLLLDMNKLDEAEEQIREAVRIYETALGADHRGTITANKYLGRIVREQGNVEEAETIHRAMVESTDRTMGPESLYAIANRVELARTLAAGEGAERHAEADALFRAALDSGHELLSSANRASVLRDYAEALAGWGRFADAGTRLDEAYALVSGERGVDHPSSQRMARRIAELYETWDEAEPGNGHGETAARWRRAAGG